MVAHPVRVGDGPTPGARMPDNRQFGRDQCRIIARRRPVWQNLVVFEANSEMTARGGSAIERPVYPCIKPASSIVHAGVLHGNGSCPHDKRHALAVKPGHRLRILS